MLRGIILSIFSVMTLGLSMLAEAQSRYPAHVSSIKEDGRFIAKLGTSNPQSLISANGLVQSLDIEIEWWSLIGQAVEIYGIRWERGYSYNLGSETLSRNSLGKYPDLVTRFDDLKPTNIKVSFDATFITDNNSSGPTFFRSGNASATKTTDNFLIAESGKMMRDFSPSSPRDWKSFISFPGHFGHSQNLSADEANLRAENTFKAAQKIVFKNLRITEINLPDASARAIYDEYIEREKKEKAEKDCKEINVCEEEKDSSKDDEDDFWGDEDSTTETSSNANENDDFWNGETSKSAIEKNDDFGGGEIKPQDDFWGDEDSSTETSSNANENDDFWGSSETSAKNNSKPQDDFWGESSNGLSQTEPSFEIKRNNNGHYGVVSSDGSVLIPFRDWSVLKYRGGLASVVETKRTLLSKEKRRCKKNCDGKGYRLIVFSHDCRFRFVSKKYWVNSKGTPVSEIDTNTSSYTEGCN